ncbi:hypothetical protein A5784_35070 [Mycobacterium sp. 852013-50091_SCH5140682]|uniref:hypothetical protein n=1 Tax=Mycobacterium sp. 852013-50091_SCH5140682 TaxID=1834109 RepID=UPI00080166F5|nr:hypothetical protein [Mycobacterium sp. 852013-50091_SCH5140682]OBC11422.1 hypothetical protein A5784_35070 [Mycobacterium sp. 852013-50091_SCH5140682]
MAAEVLMESYVLATGYAALMGADSASQHLFARRYDQPVTVDQLALDWAEFRKASRSILDAPDRCEHGGDPGKCSA